MGGIRKYWALVCFGICALLDWYFGPANGLENAQTAFIGALIGGVASLAGGVAGAIGGNNRRKRAEELINKKQRRLDAWRDAEMNTNFLDRTDSRAALRRVNEYNKEAQKADDTNAVKRGLTDEAKVAKAARLNRGYADTVSQISGLGAQHKDRVQQQYMSETSNLDNMKIAQQMDASGASNLASGIAGAGSALGAALSGVGVSGTGSGAAQAKTFWSNPDYSKVQTMAQNGVGVPSLWNKYKISL